MSRWLRILVTGVHRVRQLVSELMQSHFFDQTLGYVCVDGNGDRDWSPSSSYVTA